MSNNEIPQWALVECSRVLSRALGRPFHVTASAVHMLDAGGPPDPLASVVCHTPSLAIDLHFEHAGTSIITYKGERK